MRFFFGIAVLTLTLSGCASLTQDQCQSGNWSEIGQSDAVSGYPAQRFNDHIKACQRYSITPSMAEYEKGYKQGLLRYCTLSNGFSVGRNGYSYQGICPIALEPTFTAGYRRGSNIHQIELSIASARRSYQDADNQMVKALSSKDKQLAPDIRRLRREKSRLNEEIYRLQGQRERALVEAETFLTSQEAGL